MIKKGVVGTPYDFMRGDFAWLSNLIESLRT